MGEADSASETLPVPVSASVRFVFVLALAALASGAFSSRVLPEADASGLLVSDSPSSGVRTWRLESVRVVANVRGPIAHVGVRHLVRNEGKLPLQADFVMPLPPRAMISGVRVHARAGKVTHKLEVRTVRGAPARARWMQDLRRQRDPALIRHLTAALCRARLPVIPPGARLEINLVYQQTLGTDAGLTELACPLHTAGSFEARVELETTAPLGPIYSPTHDVDVERRGANKATVRFAGSSDGAEPCLALYWSTTRSRVGATLLTYWPKHEDEGYYLVLAAPTRASEVQAALRRGQSITFVVDVSGSMTGEKLEGMRAALLRLIAGLDSDDRFNVIAYHSEVQSLWPAPRPGTDKARAEAHAFVDGLKAVGHTNIEGALRTALAMPRASNLPHVVLFLTDGRPTVGETSPEEILKATRKANAKARARIFVLGVGVDVNTVMLDRLALENGGEPTFVRPRGSIEDALAALYRRIRHPVLTEVTFEARGMQVRENLAGKLPDLFQDAQLVLAGRYRGGGPVELVLSGRDGNLEREYHYTRAAARKGEGVRSDFPARIWAMRRIAALIDAIRLRGSNATEIIDEIVRLSTRFGVLTEYTSFLAEETCTCSDVAGANRKRAKLNFEALAPKAMGGEGLAQAKGQAERRNASRHAQQVGTWHATEDGRDVKRVALSGVRMLGNRTFYWRGPGFGWVDAVTDITRKPDAVVTRWSDAFFALLAKTTPEENERLAVPGPLLLEVQGRILRIVDPS